MRVRLFPSGTLGQEREIVQQLQEGLVDFMVSGSAIWGSVAPRLQVLDFPFLWRDWDHVHRVVDGPLGLEVADYLDGAVRIRPLAWGDSFGFRQVVTRSREITDAGRSRRAEDPDDPVRDLREGDRADGRQSDADGVRRGLHVAADRRHRRLRARREHDAAAALLRSRARHDAHAPHRRHPRPVGLEPSRSTGCPPTCAPRSSRPRAMPPLASTPGGPCGGSRCRRAAHEGRA